MSDDLIEHLRADNERLYKLCEDATEVVKRQREERLRLVAEVRALRQDAERIRCPQCERLRLECGGLRAEVEANRKDAERYRWLRDRSDPDLCRYYLASDDPASKFNNPAHVDRQIDTDRANVTARDRARSA